MSSSKQTYTWPVFDLAKIWDEPDPIFEFLAGNIGMRPSVNLWYGAPGSFKTLLLQDLAMCIATKKAWLEPKPGDKTISMPISKNYNTLLLDQDSGETTIRLRFKAFARGHSIKPQVGQVSWISCPLPPIALWSPQNVSTALTVEQTILIEIVKVQASLIVIDNLGAISAGADENSRDMLDVLTAIRRLSEQTQTAIFLIHHANKKGTRTQYGARGHTSILQAVDYAFEVTREDDIGTVTCTKSRHIPVEPFSFLWTYQNTGNTLYEARFFGLEPDLSHDPLAAAISIIHQYFVDGMNQTQIVDLIKQHTNAGRHTARSAVEKLERSNELDSTTGPKNSVIYFKTGSWKGP